MIDQNTPENNNESFVRWQQLTIGERGKAINLFLGVLFATVGFVISRLTDDDFSFYSATSKWAILIGTLLGLLSICGFIAVILNRLKDFRLTTKIARLSYIKENGEIGSLRKQADKAGDVTHKFHRISLVLFALAELFVVVGFIIQVSDKF